MKEQQKTVIFYFSGTGNSLYVAKEVAKKLGDVDIIAIPQAMDRNSFDYSDYRRVGFIIPLYFMDMPVMVRNFIDKIYIPNADYTFSIVTRSSTKGIVFTGINNILMKQGKKLNYGKYISFPDSYIRWVQAYDEKSQMKICNKAEEQLDIIKQELLKEKIYVEREWALLNITFSVINKVWKARLTSINKTFRLSNDCTQCGMCIRICPAKNIKLEDNTLRWSNKCQDCMACVQGCPNKAIYFNSRTKDKRRYRNLNISKSELFYW